MRLVEVYTSTQGEGPNVGKPTQFVRFGGCNLRCPGWPCDTVFAIDPSQYRHTWEKLDPQEVFDRVADWPSNICLTGGEPLLQPTKEILELIALAKDFGYTLEMFTNGTFELPQNLDISYVMDWKLPGSGEDHLNATRIANAKRLRKRDAIKFVVKDREDFKVACQLWRVHVPKSIMRSPTVYTGVVWGELEEKQLVEWMLEAKLPWRLNIQAHNFIWPANERAR